MSRQLKDVSIALLLGIVGDAVYTLLTKTVNPGHILAIFVTAVLIYYTVVRGLARPFLVLRKSKLVNVFDNYAEAKSIILTRLRHSKKIKLTTIGGGTIFEVDWGEFSGFLESKARSGVEVRVLVLHPDSRYLEARMHELGKFKPGKFTLAEFKKRTSANVLKVKGMNKLLGLSKIQVRYYDTFPTWRLYIFDDSAFISSYLENREGHDTMVYQVTADSDLYGAFERCFDHMWAIGEIPVELESVAQQ